VKKTMPIKIFLEGEKTMLHPDEYSMKTIRELRRGEFFRLKPDSKKTYMRGDYDKSEKKFYCENFDDISDGRYFQSKKMVIVDFTF
jgi:hypothetical protein